MAAGGVRKSDLPPALRRATGCARKRARSSTDRMVVSEAAYPGSIPGGRTSRKTAEHLQSHAYRRAGDLFAGLHIELAGGQHGDFGDADHLFGNPKWRHAFVEQAVAQVEDLLMLGAAG